MGKRGPVSKAERAVLVQGDFGPKRPEPPTHLTSEQADVWQRTVATEDPEFFTTNANKDALAFYCRYLAEAERLARIIDMFQDEWLKSEKGFARYKGYQNASEKWIGLALRVATKLRITNQSRYNAKTASTASRRATEQFPWEFDAED